MESISTKAATNVAQKNNLTAQTLTEYRIASTSTTSSTLDKWIRSMRIGSKRCFKEII